MEELEACHGADVMGGHGDFIQGGFARRFGGCGMAWGRHDSERALEELVSDWNDQHGFFRESIQFKAFELLAVELLGDVSHEESVCDFSGGVEQFGEPLLASGGEDVEFLGLGRDFRDEALAHGAFEGSGVGLLAAETLEDLRAGHAAAPVFREGQEAAVAGQGRGFLLAEVIDDAQGEGDFGHGGK